MPERPAVLTLCGSSRFVDVMAVCAWLLERDEGCVALGLHLLPGWYPDVSPDHLAEAEGVAGAMDELHLRKVEMSDGIFVVDVGGYTGESTRREVARATELGLPVRRFSTDPLGVRVTEMMLESRQAGMIDTGRRR